jgi:H+-transporting ATPase
MDKKKSGLTTKEAQDLLAKYGPNLVKEKRKNNLVLFLQKFWSPISWMLEIAIILQFVLGKYDEGIIITVLLIFNSILRFSQEEHSNRALETLKKNLIIQARVLRDSIWQLVSAENLVQGDVVKLQMGDLAPADIRLFDGKILIKQSALTGESLPLEKQEGELIYAGSIINKGEATGQVVATGKQTYYGKTIS